MINDLLGKSFGLLTVLSVDHRQGRRLYWKCKCSCGNEVAVRSDQLVRGITKSCGCLQKKLGLQKTINRLIGKVFGNLTVVSFVEKRGANNYVKVRCICGNEEIVNEKFLRTVSECSLCRKKHRKRKALKIDLVGKRFDKLKVLEYNKSINKWKCVCDCGNICEVSTSCLTRKNGTKSCGCLRHQHSNNLIDLTGKTFGMLTVKSFNGFNQGHTYWNCVCTCGKEKIVDGDKLRRGLTVSCGHMLVSHNGSMAEREVLDFVAEFVEEVQEHNKLILGGKEVDMYYPQYQIGIEYNGSIYHATKGGIYANKLKLYHRDKFLACKEKGIHLINIFDVDWQNNQEKIKMYLRSLFEPQKRLFARKCIIKPIDKSLADSFTDTYHIQGKARQNSINYGLYYQDEIYAVMSFGILRMTKTNNGEYELHRYCVKDGYTILGGAEKLLKTFERAYQPKYIRSYSDNDFFMGGIYERLNFSNSGQCTPRYYWYLNGAEIKRERCQLKHLKVLYPSLLQEAYDNNAPNKEDYVMLNLGACKVYRSGNTKWEKFY